MNVRAVVSSSGATDIAGVLFRTWFLFLVRPRLLVAEVVLLMGWFDVEILRIVLDH